jgi:hypothetical protein
MAGSPTISVAVNIEALALKHPIVSSFENVPQRLEPLRHGLFQALRAFHLLFRRTVEGH